MGILARRWADWETRDDPGWLTRDDGPELGRMTPSGVRVTQKMALGLTTVWRCVDILSSAVAQAPKDVNLRIGRASYPEAQPPQWLTTPNPADPTYTADVYFGQLAVSLLFGGNYYVSVAPSIFDPQVLTPLDPTRVVPRMEGNQKVYDIKDASGKVVATLGGAQMLHAPWILLPGEIVGISPLETLRRGLGSAIAAEDFGARFFGQGASMSFGVEVPGALTKEQKADLQESLRRRYAGLTSSHAIGVLTGGAKFVSGLAPTPEQAQMLATRKFSVEDLCRPFGVPPHMVGSQEPGASSYASADVNREVFVERSVIPLAVRIESQHNRLLQVPPNIGAPNARMEFRFNLDGISRGNVQQRFNGYQAGIMAGVLKPNEAREKEDLPPDPDGDRLFMQSGTVPISTLVPPKPTTPPAEVPPL